MDNQRIATVLKEIGDILEIQGANRFRVLAYRKAFQVLSELGEELKDVYQGEQKNLEAISGIGKDLAAKIVELLTTGKCEYHQNLLKEFDRGLLEMLRVRTVGPKKVKLFYETLGIDTIAKLRKAAANGKLRDLPKMGEKSEAEILKALEEYEKHSERMMLSEALRYARQIIEYMKAECDVIDEIEYAGSLRRMKETIGDLDILVVSKKPAEVMEIFTKYEHVDNVIAKGPTKSSVILDVGIQVDLRVIPAKSFGAAMHYFTGSKEHNVALRDHAKKMDLKLNEYGLIRLKDKKQVAGKTEKEVYAALGMPYIRPELRENRGEVEAGLKEGVDGGRKGKRMKGGLPRVVEYDNLRGDLHVHSEWSDGTEPIEDVARAYMTAGFEYMALTDHSPAVTVANGLSPARFKKQWQEIDRLNKLFDGKFRILKGTECDILPDGSLDLPDEILEEMDIVVASVHSRFNMPEDEMTKRVIKAFKHPAVKIFGHPSGRLINEREPYAIDMQAVIKAAIEHKVALEIDGQPARLDLFDYYAKMANEMGAKFTIDSDAHAISQMEYLHFGIAVAQRGWLEKEDVLNTRSLEELLRFWG